MDMRIAMMFWNKVKPSDRYSVYSNTKIAQQMPPTSVMTIGTRGKPSLFITTPFDPLVI